MSGEKMQGQARWAIIKAAGVLKGNEKRLKALVEAMRREDSLVQCLAAIESTSPG